MKCGRVGDARDGAARRRRLQSGVRRDAGTVDCRDRDGIRRRAAAVRRVAGRPRDASSLRRARRAWIATGVKFYEFVDGRRRSASSSSSRASSVSWPSAPRARSSNVRCRRRSAISTSIASAPANSTRSAPSKRRYAALAVSWDGARRGRPRRSRLARRERAARCSPCAQRVPDGNVLVIEDLVSPASKRPEPLAKALGRAALADRYDADARHARAASCAKRWRRSTRRPSRLRLPALVESEADLAGFADGSRKIGARRKAHRR